MRFLVLLYCSVFTFYCNAQTISLQNSWQQHSGNLYIGVQNILRLNGDITEIDSFYGDIKSVVYQNDSLLFTVIEPGKTTIKVQFKNGNTRSFLFNAVFLPPLLLQLSGQSGKNEKFINRQDILAGSTLKVANKENELYTDYHITGYEVSIHGKELTIPGDLFSAVTVKDSRLLQRGDKINITNVWLLNKATGMKLQAGINKQFEVL